MKDQLLAPKIQDICIQNGISFLGLFGSYAGGNEKPASDIDLLVEYKSNSPVKTLFDHLDVQYQFEEILNKKVDLVTKRSLHPYIRESVLKNLETIYAQ